MRADPRADARLIMIAQHPIRPTALWNRGLILIDESRELARIPGCMDQLEVEWQMGTCEILAIVGNETLQRQIDLTDKDPPRIFLQHHAHLAHHLMHLWLIG